MHEEENNDKLMWNDILITKKYEGKVWYINGSGYTKKRINNQQE